MQQTMPPASPDSLPQATSFALARFLRSENGLADEASDETAAEPSRPARDASASQATAPEMRVEEKRASTLTVSGMQDDPYAKAHAERLQALKAKLQPVSDEMLSKPAAADWPTWPRSRSPTGFPPLTQIDQANESTLGGPWARHLRPGTNQAE